MAQLKATLGDCMAAEEMEQLWHEYEKGETEEAKLVKDFDKVIEKVARTAWETSAQSFLSSSFIELGGALIIIAQEPNTDIFCIFRRLR